MNAGLSSDGSHALPDEMSALLDALEEHRARAQGQFAARLSGEAGSDEILLSQRAYAAVESRVDAEPVAGLHRKGFSRPVEAYRLLRIR